VSVRLHEIIGRGFSISSEDGGAVLRTGNCSGAAASRELRSLVRAAHVYRFRWDYCRRRAARIGAKANTGGHTIVLGRPVRPRGQRNLLEVSRAANHRHRQSADAQRLDELGDSIARNRSVMVDRAIEEYVRSHGPELPALDYGKRKGQSGRQFFGRFLR
jgi:hypothetical protein